MSGCSSRGFQGRCCGIYIPFIHLLETEKLIPPQRMYVLYYTVCVWEHIYIYIQTHNVYVYTYIHTYTVLYLCIFVIYSSLVVVLGVLMINVGFIRTQLTHPEPNSYNNTSPPVQCNPITFD